MTVAALIFAFTVGVAVGALARELPRINRQAKRKARRQTFASLEPRVWRPEAEPTRRTVR